eukprot:4530418-Pyramimonas_sp.AAC.1
MQRSRRCTLRAKVPILGVLTADSRPIYRMDRKISSVARSNHCTTIDVPRNLPSAFTFSTVLLTHSA